MYYAKSLGEDGKSLTHKLCSKQAVHCVKLILQGTD